MKNLFFLLLCVSLLSCSKNKKEEVVPAEVLQVQEVETSTEPIVLEPQLLFTVQIAALKNKNETLANLENIHIFQENSLIKYRLGDFETYKEARQSRAQLIKKYTGAFVQALLNDAPISITEALAK